MGPPIGSTGYDQSQLGNDKADSNGCYLLLPGEREKVGCMCLSLCVCVCMCVYVKTQDSVL